ncbi:UNVERIFIED_CONTAM: hypothetical protein PYX00_006013 [Menopon gallinae]|uniref:Hydroxymethylglutaryl-CoA synthase n=1 Tax=Menopon gallinae TaxID=328185 RepID=A0AAW2HTR8_9NEOP
MTKMNHVTETHENNVKWPKDVGILAIEVYIPVMYVDQEELERYDNVSTGKYTIGLGQKRMTFCNDREDIHSLCLTVTKNLLERYNIKPEEIGRLEVGTETIIDKSKSVKTVLMQLFPDNNDMEGIDTTNACYGGTAALFNALNWVESSAWDKRYALVVCADIAVYAKGTARPTGGAGAIAMLVGPEAPLVVERGVRSSYMTHAYDFYKPDMLSEYPVVDGPLSIKCYFSALDKCYNRYKEKASKTNVKRVESMYDFNGILFHCPYSKLVQKSVARLYYNDYLKKSDEEKRAIPDVPDVTLEESYFNKDIEKIFLSASKDIFSTRTEPSLWLAKQVGNMYTPSLYGGLVSYLLNTETENLFGARLGLFSYGSGLASSFFSIKITDDRTYKLRNLVSSLTPLKKRLEGRCKVSPEEFEKILLTREEMSHTVPWVPKSSTQNFYPGTYYLVEIDSKHRRIYNRIHETLN